MRDAGSTVGNASPGTTVLVGRLFRVRKGREKRFEKGPPKEPEQRPARIALQLALAYRIKWAIEAGEIRDQAEAARRLGMTRARVSQILDLTLLAPGIQERLLNVEVESLSERALRSVSRIQDWNGQQPVLRERPLPPDA